MKKTAVPLLVVALVIAAPLAMVTLLRVGDKIIVVPDDYPTVAAAVGNATQGDTILVKKGIYEEHSLAINKTVTVTGEDANNTIIKNIDKPPSWDPGASDFPPPDPDVIQISASSVKLSNFTIIGTGTCIRVSGQGSLIIGNRIKGLNNAYGFLSTIGVEADGNNTIAISNLIEGARTGIRVYGAHQVISQNSFKSTGFCIESTGVHNVIVGNKISDSGSQGISLSGNFNSVHNNIIEGQGSGISVIGIGNTISGNNISQAIVGINLQPHWDKSVDYKGDNIICGNWIVNNREGIEINSGENNTVYGNFISNNQIGISVLWDQTGAAFEGGVLYFEPDRDLWQTAYSNTFYHNNFVGNGQGAADWSWQGTNAWDNGVEGNYWSDYSGADTNNDGIGDRVYVVNKPYRVYYSSGDLDRLYYPSMVNPNEVVDHNPLMIPFDIESASIEPPEWTSSILGSLPEHKASEPFPFVPVAAASISVAAVVLVGVGLLLYRRKRQGEAGQP